MTNALAPLFRFILAVAVLGAAAGCQTPPLERTLPQGVYFREVQDYPMAYTQVGRGPTVVLVHGSMCDLRCLADLQVMLSDRYRVVSVSLRHFFPEKWEGEGGDFSSAQHTRDLEDFLEKMRPPVRLVGHSYGGLIAAEVARRRPDLVSHLVLAEAGTSGLLSGPSPTQVEASRRFADSVAQAFQQRGIDPGLEFAVDRISGPGTWASYPEVIKMFHRDNAWSIVGVTRDSSPRDDCAAFGSIQVPTLLVKGANTSPVFQRLLDAQARCLPGARTVTIPHAGHAVMLNTADFYTAVSTFFRSP